MRKKCNVIQINGVGGVALVIFIICCAATGFIIFPSWLCMHAWNFVAEYFNLPVMNLLHGSMLWLIIALAFVATHMNKSQPIQFGSFSTIDRDEMRKRIEKLRAQNIASLKQNEQENENINNIKEEN